MNTHDDQRKQESLQDRFRFSVEPVGLTGEHENKIGEHMTNEHEHDDAASAILRRFHNCIEQVSWLMVRTFEPYIEYEDAKAEASILICVYAGIAQDPFGLGHFDKLDRMTESAEGDAERLQALVTKQLSLDLGRKYGREASKRIPALDISNLPRRLVHDDEDFESRTISQMLLRNEMRDRYPTLCRVYLDDVKEIELAEEEGVTDRAIRKRITVEKKAALEDPDMFDIIAPRVQANIPLYSTAKHGDIPSPAQIWAWNVEGVCVECGGILGLHAVKNTCSFECWNYARGRRTDNEQKQWDYFFWYGLFDGDPRKDFPESYTYEGWASWAMNNDNQSEWDLVA